MFATDGAEPLGLSGIRAFALDCPGQADRRTRPRRRRAFRIDRPARLDMRWRKPCLRDRLRLLGWKVRFISLLVQPGTRHVKRHSGHNSIVTRPEGRQPHSAGRSTPARNVWDRQQPRAEFRSETPW